MPDLLGNCNPVKKKTQKQQNRNNNITLIASKFSVKQNPKSQLKFQVKAKGFFYLTEGVYKFCFLQVFTNFSYALYAVSLSLLLAEAPPWFKLSCNDLALEMYLDSWCWVLSFTAEMLVVTWETKWNALYVPSEHWI